MLILGHTCSGGAYIFASRGSMRFRSLLLLLIVLNFYPAHAFDPTLGVATVVGISAIGSYVYKNYIYSCQWNDRLEFGSFDLRYNLTHKLHGQPLVVNRLYPAIIRHINTKRPAKPLVLSFHGPTGTGKNYASRILADAITVRPSQFEVISCINLCPCADPCPAERVITCVQKLQERIRVSLGSCGRTIFVFDEVENLPPGIIDGIRSFLDYAPDSKENEHRYSIFIFLTNIGASSIMEIAYDAYLRGEHRHEISVKKLETALTDASFNERSGFMRSKLILKDYIDMMIPFFPLEKDHITKCIKDYLKLCYNKVPSGKFIDTILAEVRWVPPDGQVYARSGCKKMENKVDVFIDSSFKKTC